MFIFYEKQNLLIGDISTVKIHFISFGRRTFLAINSVIQFNNFEKVSFEQLKKNGDYYSTQHWNFRSN